MGITNSIPSPLRILLVEDSGHDTIAFRRALDKGDLETEITHFVRAEEALPSLEEWPLLYDLVVADYKLPGITGLELCNHILSREMPLPCIILTGAGTENIAVNALKAGVSDYLCKDTQQNYLGLLPILLSEVVRKYQDSKIARIYSREKEVLVTISEMFLNSKNTEILCRKLPDVLAAGFSFPVSAILFLTENRQEMVIKGITGNTGSTLLEKRVPLEKTICCQAITEGKPVFNLDVPSSPNRYCFLKDSGIKTCLSVPIKGKRTDVMGALVVADRKQRPDAQIHIPVLQDIAYHLGQELERKQIEDELRLHSKIISNMAEGVYLVQASSNQIIYANPVFEKMFGYESGELFGEHVSIVNAPTEKSPQETAAMILEALSDKRFWQGEVENIKKNGTPFWCNATVSEFNHHKYGKVWVAIHTDITNKKEIQDSLKKSKKEWVSTFDAMADIVTIQDKDMRIVRANKAAHHFFQEKYGELTGKYCYEVFRGTAEPCPGCPLSYTIKDINNHSEILTHENLGKTFHVSSAAISTANGDIQYLVHTAKDITEQKRLEEDLFQAHKMEAIGTLAGGIAHDFNNILSAIIGFTELAKSQVATESEVADDLNEVLQASKRATGLVKQILTISRKGAGQNREELQPYFIVKEALKLMRASLPTTIDIQANIDSKSGSTLADPTNVHQIVVNLCTNALHAMEEETGLITITLKGREVGAEEIPEHFDMASGPFIELSVSDTGCGMDKQTRKRIFEPYFTTKEVGKGTGLGLSVVQGIVKGLGGMITVESKLGKGSTFHVYFPTMQEEKPPLLVEAAGPVQRGTERILIVDDESIIVALQEATLTRLGYTVTAKTSSEEALTVFQNTPNDFDLLITDQTMPKLSGANLSREVLSLRPDMPIIVCTGYSTTLTEERAMEIGIKEYLNKPVERAKLAGSVRSVLDKK